jgi:beta-lactamase superfamily II metal-dependent hydrolase
MGPDPAVAPAPPVEPVPAERLTLGAFADECTADRLVHFLLNVGDGDTQLLLLPEQSGTRRMLVVDVATTRKLPALIATLRADPVLGPKIGDIALVVATHPHNDHIGGMPELLDLLHADVRELWESGFFYTSHSYNELMRAIDEHGIPVAQPTSGMTRWIDSVKVEALSPSIQLRNSFDTYGVDANNASIVLRLEFPSVVARPSRGAAFRRLILGGDAQTRAWAGVVEDFPELAASTSEFLKSLRMAQGGDALNADVFKVSHHGSKHGVNLELVERIRPQASLISSVAGGGEFNFPHLLAQEALREALQPTTSSRAPRQKDWDLGIHYTGAVDTDEARLGSIGVVVPPSGDIQVWRFGDRASQAVDLAGGRRFA